MNQRNVLSLSAIMASQDARRGGFLGLSAVSLYRLLLIIPALCASVRGWYSGTAADQEDTLLFSQSNDIASMNEIFPLEAAQAAYERMMGGKARFRVVLNIGA
jgi:D-arabinose 1-dehydrogenase-like Zn-dependent alcohol dehydrogenase